MTTFSRPRWSLRSWSSIASAHMTPSREASMTTCAARQSSARSTALSRRAAAQRSQSFSARRTASHRHRSWTWSRRCWHPAARHQSRASRYLARERYLARVSKRRPSRRWSLGSPCPRSCAASACRWRARRPQSSPAARMPPEKRPHLQMGTALETPTPTAPTAPLTPTSTTSMPRAWTC